MPVNVTCKASDNPETPRHDISFGGISVNLNTLYRCRLFPASPPSLSDAFGSGPNENATMVYTGWPRYRPRGTVFRTLPPSLD